MNINRLKSYTGSICHPRSQYRDLIDENQIRGNILTDLKAIADDIGSEAPCTLFLNSKAEQRMQSDWQAFEDAISLGEPPFDDHSSRVRRH
jgi:hypothetical protein